MLENVGHDLQKGGAESHVLVVAHGYKVRQSSLGVGRQQRPQRLNGQVGQLGRGGRIAARDAQHPSQEREVLGELLLARGRRVLHELQACQQLGRGAQERGIQVFDQLRNLGWQTLVEGGRRTATLLLDRKVAGPLNHLFEQLLAKLALVAPRNQRAPGTNGLHERTHFETHLHKRWRVPHQQLRHKAHQKRDERLELRRQRAQVTGQQRRPVQQQLHHANGLLHQHETVGVIATCSEARLVKKRPHATVKRRDELGHHQRRQGVGDGGARAFTQRHHIAREQIDHAIQKHVNLPVKREGKALLGHRRAALLGHAPRSLLSASGRNSILQHAGQRAKRAQAVRPRDRQLLRKRLGSRSSVGRAQAQRAHGHFQVCRAHAGTCKTASAARTTAGATSSAAG